MAYRGGGRKWQGGYMVMGLIGVSWGSFFGGFGNGIRGLLVVDGHGAPQLFSWLRTGEETRLWCRLYIVIRGFCRQCWQKLIQLMSERDMLFGHLGKKVNQLVSTVSVAGMGTGNWQLLSWWVLRVLSLGEGIHGAESSRDCSLSMQQCNCSSIQLKWLWIALLAIVVVLVACMGLQDFWLVAGEYGSGGQGVVIQGRVICHNVPVISRCDITSFVWEAVAELLLNLQQGGRRGIRGYRQWLACSQWLCQ